MGCSLNKRVKAILFDSGRVLNGPATGHWFITPNFFRYVDKKKYMDIEQIKKDRAFEKADEYIKERKLITDENEEYKYFLEYYKIFFKWLPELNITDEKIVFITIDYVYNPIKYSFFNDALTLIPELSKTYKLAIVSDAWPSLENVFMKAGMRDYFSSFVISSKLGVSKPDKLMYKTALDELGVLPEEAVFVDDSIKNCNGARKLGITSFVLCRDWKVYTYNRFINKNYNIIKDLNKLKKLLIRKGDCVL